MTYLKTGPKPKVNKRGERLDEARTFCLYPSLERALRKEAWDNKRSMTAHLNEILEERYGGKL